MASNSALQPGVAQARTFRKEPKRWMHAASRSRWVTLMTFNLLIITSLAVAIQRATAAISLRHFNTNFGRFGLGELSPYTLINIGLPNTDPAGFLSNVLVANFPQLIMSAVHLLENAIVTTFLVQREYDRMYIPGPQASFKPLRVSEPRGLQRSTYFISLPWRFGIWLYVSSILMHFLMSESIVLARVTALFSDGTVDYVNSFSSVGYSAVATCALLGVLTFKVVALVGLSWAFRYEGTMRLVATCSRAIGAACHALEDDRQDGYLMPVHWRVVELKGGIGRCAFTTAPGREDEMDLLRDGALYM